MEIEKILMVNGKSLKDFHGMPIVDSKTLAEYGNVLLYNELSYDSCEMAQKHTDCVARLNHCQMTVYEEVTTAIDNDECGFFFVYGHGGTGMTFIWKTLSYKLRAEKK